MLKIMLVDDDIPVLEFLAQSIPWEELGMSLCGSCDSAVQALQLSESVAPDILITDIGMPHMNGLELIDRIKQRRPEIKTIILSCHDEFTFAQRAVQLNVDDYILKETIEIEQFVGKLVKLKEQLMRKQAEHRQLESLEHITRQNRHLFKERFIQATLFHPVYATEEWHSQAKSYGIDLERYHYLPVLCMVDRYMENQQRFVSKDNFIYAVENIVHEITGDAGAVFRLTDKALLLLFPMQSKVAGLTSMGKVTQEIQAAMRRYLRLSVTFLRGATITGMNSFRDHVVVMHEGAHDARFYMSEGSMAAFTPIDYTSEDIFGSYVEAFEQMKQAVLSREDGMILQVLDDWFGRIRAKAYAPSIVKEWFLKHLLDVRLKYKSLQHFHTVYSIEVLHQSVLESENLEQLQEIALTVFRQASQVMTFVFQQSQRREIVEAKQYVEKHIDQKINLKRVADHLHLNMSYFSRLFKKETGENFVEYVTRTKMEKAKELIDQTDLTVEALAETLGYDNKSYFLKCFKQFHGMTPSEYAGICS